jgi:hypothetical protein
MAPPLAPPKGFKFRRFFSRPQIDVASSSQFPPTDIVIPNTQPGGIENPTPVGDNTPKRKSYEKNRQFQLLWLPLFPWAEPVYKDEEETKVICKICTKIRGKPYVLVAKNDNLWKHQGRKTAKTLGHGVPIGEKYMNRNSIHNKNERLFVAIPIDSIQAQVSEATVKDRKKK